ncbi:MAG TPA: DUF3788 family protein [Daejeonella sp.]|uniref:DUF3788 family protein n=1 Tax=Daejeonella sp. TaxID=2805397 RepID=UPI002ED8C844
MEAINPKQLLRDPEQIPDDKLFQRILDKPNYHIVGKIVELFKETGLALEWRYYKDGKAWLGKATYKKKTILWLSLWDESIKTSFYFTEKTRSGVLNLHIDHNVKSSFAAAKSIGKLIPLILEIKNMEALKDLKSIIEYKKKMK